MGLIDYSIFFFYMLTMLLVGVYFFRKNQSHSDYFLGGKSIGPWHIGLSVVATDVGGGFSIGLGGLGFGIGLSGSWLLFTGLIGAWLSAVFLIPKVKKIEALKELYTLPQLFERIFNKRVAFVAAIISVIGYIGFTSSQILAGAKLASASIPAISTNQALLVMGLIAVLYTAFGGIKAVIYTDTVQWLLLIFGLSCLGIPLAVYYLGGPATILEALPQKFFSLTQISWVDLVNWAITIIPIWFVGMTLYQRIYASKSVQDAKKAWFIAGLFEWPIMAFMGVLLGVLARVAFNQNLFEPLGFSNTTTLDPELGLPLLLRTILPTGLLGLLLSAYFSAILSTADSCLMAASGCVTTDLFGVRATNKWMNPLFTLLIGAVAVVIAAFLENVLELMLYSYAFMVSGLFVPLTMGLLANKVHSWGALIAMISGGSCTLLLLLFQIKLPFELDANLFGLALSFLVYVVALRMGPPEKNTTYGIY